MEPGCSFSTVSLLELLGVGFCSAALLCSLCTTLLSTWLSLSTQLLPSESYEIGLWQSCVVQDLGVTECRPYDSLLGLPPDIKLARLLMCAALAVGLLALLLAAMGLRLVNGCHPQLEDSSWKRVMKMAAAFLCVLAGLLGLTPVSYIAHLTVQRFFDASVPEVLPRWDFGDALFVGWTAGVLHLAAGALLLASCCCEDPEDCLTPGYHTPGQHTPVCHTPGHIPLKQHRQARTEYV